MRWTPLLLLAALGGCGVADSDRPVEWVHCDKRTDRVGDRYEVELRSSSTRIGATSLTAAMRYTDEVLAVSEGRATRVRRTFRAGGRDGEPAVTELDPRAGAGSGSGVRTDHFRQFERLVPYGAVGVRQAMDGALGAPPSGVLDIPDAAWLDSWCSSLLRRVAVLDGRRVAEFDVRITFDGGAGPPRLEGQLRFDLDAGLLREVDLRGSANGRSYELRGVQDVVPAAAPR